MSDKPEKFDPEKHDVKVRGTFVRGRIQKTNGAKLTEADLDTMTRDQINDEVTFGRLELVDKSAAVAPAGAKSA